MTRAQLFDGWRIEVTVREGIARTLTRSVIARVVTAALNAAEAPPGGSVSVTLTNDDELAELNAAHLGHDGPTDVLSFPLLPPEAFPPHVGRVDDAPEAITTVRMPPFALPPRSRRQLGDIMVSVERAAAQAAEGRGGQTGDVRWSTADELRLLLTHGTLHLCGWDHADPDEEAAMRALERRLLGTEPV